MDTKTLLELLASIEKENPIDAFRYGLQTALSITAATMLETRRTLETVIATRAEMQAVHEVMQEGKADASASHLS